MYLGPHSNSDGRLGYHTRSPSPLAMKPSYNGLSNLHGGYLQQDSATGSSDGVSPLSSNSLSGNVIIHPFFSSMLFMWFLGKHIWLRIIDCSCISRFTTWTLPTSFTTWIHSTKGLRRRAPKFEIHHCKFGNEEPYASSTARYTSVRFILQVKHLFISDANLQ